MDLRRGRGKKDVVEKDVDSVVEPLQTNGETADVAQDGAHEADGNNVVEDEREKVAEVKETRGRGGPGRLLQRAAPCRHVRRVTSVQRLRIPLPRKGRTYLIRSNA
jgi:hypothetical protein